MSIAVLSALFLLPPCAAPDDATDRRPNRVAKETDVDGVVGPPAVLARVEELLVSTDRLDAVPPDWKITAGRWRLKAGELTGEEIPDQRHGAGIWSPIRAQDVVVAYDVRVGPKNRNATMSLNAPGPRHLCRVVFEPDRISLRKPDQDHRSGPDEQLTLDQRAVAVEPGRWYSVVVEAVGDDVLVRIDGKATLFGSHKAYATSKTLVQFTAGGEDAVTYRDVRIWKARPNPDWPKLREATLAERGK